MHWAMRAATICTCLAAIVTVSGCGGESSSSAVPLAVSPSSSSSLSSSSSTPTYQIGGTVSGLTGDGLVLALNGGQSLAVGAGGNFVFPQGVASGTSYTVTVSTQPNVRRELCVVNTGSGVVGTANVTAIQVNCSAVIGFLYVVADSNIAATGTQLFSFGIAPGNGTLVPFGTPLNVGSDSDSVQLARSPNGQFLYAGNWTDATITVFAVDSNYGTVSAMGPPVATGFAPISMVMASSGYLFVWGGAPAAPTASPVVPSVSEYAADPTTGALTPVGTPIPETSGGGVLLTASADGTFLYTDVVTTQLGSAGAVSQTSLVTPYRIDPASGSLSAGPSKTFSDPMGSLLVGPNDQTLYLADNAATTPEQAAATLVTYGIDSSSGALTSQKGSPLSLDSNGGGLVLDSTGQYLYVVDNFNFTPEDDAVQTLSINAATGLPSASIAPLVVTGSPTQLLIDPSGQFAFLLSQARTLNGPDYLSTFTFGSAGQLIPAGSPQAIGSPAYGGAIAIIE